MLQTGFRSTIRQSELKLDCGVGLALKICEGVYTVTKTGLHVLTVGGSAGVYTDQYGHAHELKASPAARRFFVDASGGSIGRLINRVMVDSTWAQRFAEATALQDMNEPAPGYEDLDLNRDGVIDNADADLMLFVPSDLNKDFVVNLQDFAQWAWDPGERDGRWASLAEMSGQWMVRAYTYCGADVTADGYVDLKDLAMVGQHFKDAPCTGQNTWCSHADINLDGRVDWLDVQALAGQWLTNPSQALF